MEILKKILKSMNENGIMFPVVHDPVSKRGSITCTMVIVSFGICVIGVIGKVSKVLDGVDLTAAHSLLVISLSAYLGRKLQQNGKQVEMSDIKPEEGKEA